MDTKSFEIINAINCEGIEPGMWTINDMGGLGTRADVYFGTIEDIELRGYVLALYANDGDWFSFIELDSADHVLHIDREHYIYIWEL